MTHYELLGVDPRASPDDIKQAFRAKAIETHPDLRRGSADEIRQANREFSELSNAYRELIDPAKRTVYDQNILPQSVSMHPRNFSVRAAPAAQRITEFDLKPYYEELDAIREEIWSTPRNEFVRDTLKHAAFLILAAPVYVLLLRYLFAESRHGRADLRVLAGSITVPLLALWSMWQLSERFSRIRAAGGFLRMLRRGKERRRRRRRGTSIELGFLPIILLAFGFADAVLIAITDRLGNQLHRGVILSIVPLIVLAWIAWRNWRFSGQRSAQETLREDATARDPQHSDQPG